MRVIIKILIHIMLAFCILGAGLFMPYAQKSVMAQAKDIELIGNAQGLVLVPEGAKLFDLDNLNPGDTVKSTLKIQNNYSGPFTLYIRAEQVDREEQPDLLKQLQLTVKYKGNTIYSGPASGESGLGENISLGTFAPGASGELVAKLELPGPETGNEFQGKSAQIKWIFTAQTSGDGSSGGSTSGNRRDQKDGSKVTETPVEIVEEEPIPQGQPSLPEKPKQQPSSSEKVIEPEPVPAGALEMPKTGESLPYPYYIVGGFAILAGIKLLRSKKL
ncbi:MAG: hypothetical protein PWQ97_300 [Tepidanaerobacteraceae bacterium]|nr:hypothetical protein [Tepidanaerobacteraceae bacterium]